MFRTFQRDLAALAVKDRRRVDDTGDVIVVEATARNVDRLAPVVEEQMRQHAFGVFVVDRATGRRRFTVDVFSTERRLDYAVDLHDVTADRLTIRRAGGTYGDFLDQVTYFWDVAAGKVLERVVHGHFGVTELVEHAGVLWAAGSDGHRSAMMKLRPRDTAPAEIVASVDGRPLAAILEARVDRDAPVFLGATTRYARHGDRWEAAPNPEARRYQQNGMVAGAPFGLPDVAFWAAEYIVRRHAVTVGTRRFLVWSDTVAANAHGAPPAPGIWELDGIPRFEAMPAPTYETFAKLRRQRVTAGYTRGDTRLETAIGPIQVDGSRIGFGTTFYDGEGASGVGGIGWFDTDARRWHVVHPPAIADWSASAILVEPDAVWLGLVRHTEGRSPGGGLVRWDRTSGATRRIAIAGVIGVIRRFAGQLYAGTSDGVVIVDGAKPTRVTLVPTRGGSLTAVSRAR